MNQYQLSRESQRCDHGLAFGTTCPECAAKVEEKRAAGMLDPGLVEIFDTVDPQGFGVTSHVLHAWLRRFDREPVPSQLRSVVRFFGGLPIRNSRSISGKLGLLHFRRAADGRELVRTPGRLGGSWALKRFE